MIFQALDSKEECIGIYANGSIITEGIEWKALNSTWKYSPSLRTRRGMLEYAYIASSGSTLRDCCPITLREDFAAAEGKMRAFFRAFSAAKVSLDENCFFEMVPGKFLRDYYDIRNQICEFVFRNHEKPKNYKFLSAVHEMLEEISFQSLSIAPEELKAGFHQVKTRNFYNKLLKMKPNVRYNLYGTKTGRLTTHKNTFPALTLDRDHRHILKPKNDLFVELDYNGAEIRTLLALSGKAQPNEDIHEWNLVNCARNLTTRSEMKERFFAWLYNPDSRDSMLERYYDKGVSVEYWDGERVSTPYGREIDSDKHHALNYLIQSTTNDLVLEKALEAHSILSDKKSNICFTVHDSIVIDYSMQDRESLTEIVSTLKDTRFGRFNVNVSAGRNYGNLKEITWK